MGFGKFPSFKPKPQTSVSEAVYPNTKYLRDHKEALESSASKSVERFEQKFTKQVLRMFDEKREGRVNFDALTDEEVQDIKNFIAHAAKRLAAGAVSSPAYRKDLKKRKLTHALYELAPADNIGHDAMHSVMAYARTHGASLVPAYMKILDQKTLYTYADSEAGLEEGYVVTFANLGEVEKKIRELQAKGLSGEELVERVMESVEDTIVKTQGFDKSDPLYPRNNRWPEFVTIVRNLISNVEQGNTDQNFEVHEFQRVLQPLLERLRGSSE